MMRASGRKENISSSSRCSRGAEDHRGANHLRVSFLMSDLWSENKKSMVGVVRLSWGTALTWVGLGG